MTANVDRISPIPAKPQSVFLKGTHPLGKLLIAKQALKLQ